jgi:hypothetical protein
MEHVRELLAALTHKRSYRTTSGACLLNKLPLEVFQDIARLASTPTTPAACLLPLVCKTWQQAAHEAQLLVDISIDITLEPQDAPVSALGRLWSIASRAAAALGTPTAAAPATTKGEQLAAWLAKHRGNVRSLHIARVHPGEGPAEEGKEAAWERDLTSIIDALTGTPAVPWQRVAPAMPHLVRLDLPILGLPQAQIVAYLAVLAGCPCLQHLVLEHFYGVFWEYEGGGVTYQELAAALAPLKQLETLRVALCASLEAPGAHRSGRLTASLTQPNWDPDAYSPSLAGLLRQLPSSLEDINLQSLETTCGDIPLSCITHFTNLKQWEYPAVRKVLEDDGSYSSSGDNSSSSSSSTCGGAGCAITALTALTRLCIKERLFGDDLRLQLPNLCSLQLSSADLLACQQLQGMRNLQTLAIDSAGGTAGINGDAIVVRLGMMTQVQHLELNGAYYYYGRIFDGPLPEDLRPWTVATAHLTQLKTLKLIAHMALTGGTALLSCLTQLDALTVECASSHELSRFLPAGAQGWAATAAGAVVGVVAAAVGAGWQPLKRLVLVVKTQEEVQQVRTATQAALPGVVVVVQHV